MIQFYDQKQIDNKGIFNSFMSKVVQAEIESNSLIQPQGNKLAVLILKAFLSDLNAQRNKHVNEEAYQVLNNDASALISVLQGN